MSNLLSDALNHKKTGLLLNRSYNCTILLLKGDLNSTHFEKLTTLFIKLNMKCEIFNIVYKIYVWTVVS